MLAFAQAHGWASKGYCGSGNVSGLLDTLPGRTAIVAGNAAGVFEEVARIMSPEHVVFSANDVGVYLPRVDHMLSLHSDKLTLWAALRRASSEAPFLTHGGYDHPGLDYAWQGLTPIFALSGYFAAQVAYLMGAQKIILCGCPGDERPRFWETEARNYDYQSRGVVDQLEKEMARVPEFKARVRSMSGFTKNFFGGV